MSVTQKWPFIQWFVLDWLADPQVSRCEPATRGILFDWLLNMHATDRSGVITGSLDILARLGRCTAVQCRAALDDLKQTRAADITEGRNGEITVTNRRMNREHKARKSGAERVGRHRDAHAGNGACNARKHRPVTPHNHNLEPEPDSDSPPPSSPNGAFGKGSGENPAPDEIPTVEQAMAMTMTVGIPEDFVRYVYADWSSRDGKDGNGVVVRWLGYVTKRWAREQVEWKAGTHKGKNESKNGGKLNPRNVGLSETASDKSADVAAFLARQNP